MYRWCEMSRVIESLLSFDNLRYLLSLVIGAILSFSTLWHSVNKNAYELKAQSEKIMETVKESDENKAILKEIEKDIVLIKLMLVRLEKNAD